MTNLQQRIFTKIYSAVLRLHPPSFRNQFGREMALDFEDALRERGFAPLLGDAFLSLARQWKARALTGPELGGMEIAQPVPSHPFLAGQYVMVGRGLPLTVFDLACASVLSVMLLLTIGFAASIPNTRVMANLQAPDSSHDGGIDNAGPHPPGGAVNQGHREAAGAQELLLVNNGGAPFHGIVRLGRGPGVAGKSLRSGLRGSSPVGTLADVVRQFTLVSIVLWLTSLFLRRSRGVGRKVVFGTLGLLGIAASVAFGAVPMPPIHAQIVHATAPLPSFEVATVKPRDPKVTIMITPPGSQNVVRSAGPTRLLVALAYNLGGTASQRIVGGPDWIDDQKTSYVIEGKIPEDLYAQMQKMTAAERHNEAILMMQSLLADRFKLKVHFEMREMPVYELTIAKDGPKLPAPNDTTPPAPTPGSTDAPRPPQMGGGEVVTKDGLRIRNMTLDGMLTAPRFGLGGRPIVNKTGLTGTYNITLNWLPDLPHPAGSDAGAPPVPEGQASIFTALQEQFGLKLAAAKAPMEVVVIDSIERPSEN